MKEERIKRKRALILTEAPVNCLSKDMQNLALINIYILAPLYPKSRNSSRDDKNRLIFFLYQLIFL